jgi:hypothetical protein
MKNSNIHSVIAYSHSGEIIQFCISHKKESSVSAKVNLIIFALERQFKLDFKRCVTTFNADSMPFNAIPVTYTKSKGIGKGTILIQNNAYAPRCVLRLGAKSSIIG